MKYNKSHGESANHRTKEYKCWVSMKQRCTNANFPHYHNYGGRGITVCKEWMDSFEKFLADVGRAPEDVRGWSLDRINNDGNYEPGNVRWATSKEQARNKRYNHVIEFQGERMTLSSACEILGVRASLVFGRMHHGHSFEDALKMPLRRRRNKQFVEWEGERVSLTKLAARFGIKKDVIYTRMKRGWELGEALRTPARRLCLVRRRTKVAVGI